ncbi:MAG: hypothetical protein PQJ46_06930, partial [Spirochaetales bacterium]|nr:hypothetical protein [Spirochaetales bacterium]
MDNTTLFYNADLITMTEVDYKKNKHDAVLVRNGIIEAIGKESNFSDSIKRVNLGGKTLLPGFIDAHSHFLLNGFVKHVFIDL